MPSTEPAAGSAVEQEDRSAARIPVLLEGQGPAVRGVDEPGPVPAHSTLRPETIGRGYTVCFESEQCGGCAVRVIRVWARWAWEELDNTSRKELSWQKYWRLTGGARRAPRR